jgi:type I restriction enzyme, R subunit
VRSDGLIRANEEFTAWLRGERSMPFGENNQHVTVRLIDFDDLDNNQYIVTTQYTFRAGPPSAAPTWSCSSTACRWSSSKPKPPSATPSVGSTAPLQIHDDYERFVPELFAPNVFSVATEGKDLRYGAIHTPLDMESLVGAPGGRIGRPNRRMPKGSWLRPRSISSRPGKSSLAAAPHVVLDILANFTLFATDKKKRRLKIVCRYQQYEGANKIVQRVLAGYPAQGTHLAFPGLGQVPADGLRRPEAAPAAGPAQPHRAHRRRPHRPGRPDQRHLPRLRHPQPGQGRTREELETLLRQDTRKIIITTIFKFGEAGGVLNDRENIIVLVDEAHRTQEGDLGMKMRAALPNAFLFGLTGTPINRRDRNTFYAFGAEEDEHGYMSRYGFEESIRDGATLPLHFEPRLVELHIDKDAIDAAYAELTGGLSDLDRDTSPKPPPRWRCWSKCPSASKDLRRHRPPLSGQSRAQRLQGHGRHLRPGSCLLYKAALDQHLPPEASEIVISVSGKEREDERYRPYKRDRDAEESCSTASATPTTRCRSSSSPPSC